MIESAPLKFIVVHAHNEMFFGDKIPQRVVCAGESSRVTWSSVDRRSRWNDRGYEAARARKWELQSYGQLQQDGKLQRAVRERMVAGLSTRNYWRAVEVLEGGIEKSTVSRQFVAASCNQLRVLCERRLEDLNLVVLMIDGIHFGGQVLVVALGIAEGGEKHVLGVWQGATENTTVVKGLLEDLVDRGLNRQRRYLVVIDGWKALRTGVEGVFGEQVEVQRCQIHTCRGWRET